MVRTSSAVVGPTYVVRTGYGYAKFYIRSMVDAD